MTDNSKNEKYVPKKEDFVLVQKENKIYDQKMDTKQTTFLKDAFKRFCKSKSSVVAAIIIGFVMLLAIIIPAVLPYNIDNPDPDQQLLLPKAFDAGTGFWDGTRKYTNKVYNSELGAPEGYNKNAILEGSLKLKNGEKIDIKNADQEVYKNTVSGGYYKFIGSPLEDGQTAEENTNRMENRKPFKITSTGNFNVTIKLKDEAEIISDGLKTKQAKYRITLVSGNEGASSSRKTVIADLTNGWTNDYSEKSYNLSSIIADKGLTELNNASIRIEIYRDSKTYTHVLIESIVFTAPNADEATQALLAEISMTDPSKTFFLKKDTATNKFPAGYYANSGHSEIYQANTILCDFIYDEYAAKLGDQDDYLIGQTDLDLFKKNGWCTFDPNDVVNTFTPTSDKCPIVKIHSVQEGTGEFEGVNTYRTTTTLYKLKGFTSMPRYLLGTTNDGYDLIKLSFVALRTSLLIAICTSAICFAFGLCWGAISGYFGGNVDLVMERISDILANIPFIVVMTLTLLLLGNNIVTFGLALCLTGWIGVAARTRTQFYRFKGREYILASRTLGASDKRLIFKHILPNSLGTIVTSSVLMIPNVIFSEASVAYLGLGLKGVKSFGVILSENQKFLQTYPALICLPAILISLLMISFNLFGNGLRDALNPSLKGSE